MRRDTTKLEFLDRNGKVILVTFAPRGTQASKSLSSVGVTTNADIREVRITAGHAPLSRKKVDGREYDLVVMDDFLYAEPTAI